MRDVRVRLAAVLTVVGLIAAGALTQGAGASAPTAGHGYVPGSAVLQGGPIHGMILADADQPLDPVVHDIPRLAADGVNLVSIYVTQYIDSPSSSDIHPGRFTPSDEELETAIDLAHANGMAVQLAPTLWTVNPYVWRGAFQPSDIESFFQNYRAMMNHYAELAQSHGVELLTIGSEYSAIDRRTAQWIEVAKEVRQRFSGLITYMAVTQHVALIRWWRAVDLIGVSPYYSLSNALRPTYQEMLTAWRTRWLPFVHRISQKFGQPVLFNEIGYLSALGSPAAPYKWKTTEPPSQEVQANAYAALLDAADTAPWLRGVIFYRWSGPTVPTMDRSYSPRDKLAECVLAQHWASPTAPVGLDGRPFFCLGGDVASSVGLAG